MTLCEEMGYKVGDKFEKIIDDGQVFSVGSIIELIEDDVSDCPLLLAYPLNKP